MWDHDALRQSAVCRYLLSLQLFDWLASGLRRINVLLCIMHKIYKNLQCPLSITQGFQDLYENKLENDITFHITKNNFNLVKPESPFRIMARGDDIMMFMGGRVNTWSTNGYT